MKIWIVLFVSFFSINLAAQNYGFTVGIPFIAEHLPEGRDYLPTKFIGQIEFPLRTKNRSVEETRWFICVEPQFNLVYLPVSERATNGATTAETDEIEFGANAGIRYRLPLNPIWSIHAQISAGPHYISRAYPGLQAGGYIFSDNFGIGSDIHLTPQIDLFLQMRFRHLSNAGLQEPNKGIDNWFLMLGTLIDVR